MARNEGLTINTITKTLLRSDKFAINSVRLHKAGQLETTNLDSNNYKLPKEKRQEIIEMTQTQCPKDLRDFNFNTQFWSTDILKQIIKKRYNTERKDRSYHNLFKTAGFTFHKPRTKDIKQDPGKIKEFKGL